MAEQLFQVGIKALIRNQKDEILLVHIPKMGKNQEHWDFPGGRMDPGETFLETLSRELVEEIGVDYIGEPKQLMAVLTKIKIPANNTDYPLILIVYEVRIPNKSSVRLDPNSNEDSFDWFSARDASDLLTTKFPEDFCSYLSNL